MKTPFFLLFIIVSWLLASCGSPFVGSYTHSNVLPGRKIKKEDGSEVHIMPLEMSRTELRLKHSHRFFLYNDYRFGSAQFRGWWKIKGDTLTLFYGTLGTKARRRYVFDEDYDYLNSLDRDTDLYKDRSEK